MYVESQGEAKISVYRNCISLQGHSIVDWGREAGPYVESETLYQDYFIALACSS